MNYDLKNGKNKIPHLAMYSDNKADHAGERLAHKRFGVEQFWDAHDFDAMFHTSIPSGMAAFIESLPFFFIATANLQGKCDCSFRGREYDASGRPYPLLKVINPKTLIFPDYRGNNFFNSLGNMLVNGQIGMLFIDFESRLRMRINGGVTIIEDRRTHADLWPLAQRYVQVTAEQVYGNCRSRIPHMKLVKPTDQEFQNE